MVLTATGFRDVALGLSALLLAGFLSVALCRLIRLLSKLDGVIEENRKDVRDAVSQLPSTISDIKGAVADLKAISGKAESAVSGLEVAVSGITSTMKGASAGFSDTVRAVSEAVTGIIGLFGSRRKKDPLDEHPDGKQS